MIPDFEEQMNDRLRQASLQELMPDFDKEQEWQKLSQHLIPKTRKLPLIAWASAAAILILLGSVLLWICTRENDEVASHEVVVHDNKQTREPDNATSNNTIRVADTPVKSRREVVAVATIKEARVHTVTRRYKTKEVIQNGTPCPLEICISQTMRCPNEQPAAISSYSTLEPSQSVELHYKDHGNIAKNCSITIKEIEIKSIATGETILLNSSSLPSTAQEVFSYITGQKKGDVLAGVFSSDCNNKSRKHSLKLDNSYGNLIIQ